MNLFLSVQASWVWCCQDHQYSLREDTQMAISVQTGTHAPQGKYTLLQNSNTNTDWTPGALEIPTLFMDTPLWKNVNAFPRSSPSLNAVPVALGIGIKPAAQPGQAQIKSSGSLDKDVPQSQIFCGRPFTKEIFSIGINSFIFLYYSTCVSLVCASASFKQKTSEKTILQ